MKSKIISSKIKMKKQKSKRELEDEIKMKNTEIHLLQTMLNEQAEYEKIYIEEMERLAKMEKMLTLIIQSLKLYPEES